MYLSKPNSRKDELKNPISSAMQGDRTFPPSAGSENSLMPVCIQWQ